MGLDIDRFATAIETYRPRLERQVEVLNGIIEKASTDGRAVHMNDLMYFYAFDSMGEFAFNKDFGMMRNEQWHDAANMIRRAISILGPMKSVIWLIRLGFYFLPWFWRIGDWFNALHFCQARLEHRIHVSSPTVPIRAFPLEQTGELTCLRNSLANDFPRRTNLKNLILPRTSLTKPRKMATLKMPGNGCEETVPQWLLREGKSILKD